MGVRTRRRRHWSVGLLTLAAVVTALTAAPAAAAPLDRPDHVGTAILTAQAQAKADPAAPAISRRYLRQQVAWSVCDVDASIKSWVPSAPTTRCGSVVVPMDWRHPDAHPDIRLAVAWSKATGRTQGLLTLNPGGPGVPALTSSALLAAAKPRLFGQYDVVGFDPRGFGASSTYSCLATAAQQRAHDQADQGVPDRRVRNRATHAVEVADAKYYAKACSRTELSQFVGTQQTVYDMEFLRRYLGRDQAAYDRYHFVGISYGTWLGSWYADTFPSHTGRMLLDSNLDFTASVYANTATDSFSFERRRDEMFFPWVARHDQQYGYGNTTAEVSKNFEALRVRLSRAASRGTAAVAPETFDQVIANELYVDAHFAETVDYIRYVEQVTPGGIVRTGADGVRREPASALRIRALLAGTDQPAAAGTSSYRPVPGPEGVTPVSCNDSAYPRSLDTVLKRADADRAAYPFIGYTNTVDMCFYWPYAPATRTIDLKGVPTVLMIQGEGDPATAYEGALAAHRATAKHTRLVSVDDEGEHGIYSYGVSSCAERIGDAYLYQGKLPGKDVVCAGEPLPGESKVYRLKGPVDGISYPLRTRARAATTSTELDRIRRREKLDAAARAPH